MKYVKWLAITGIVIIVIVAIWWWLSPNEPAQEKVTEWISPEISIASARITNIDGDKLEVMSKVVFKNPYPLDINTNRIDYKVYVDSIRVVQDIYEESVNIQSSDSTVVELPVEILSDSLTNVLESFEEHNIDSAQYSLETTIQADIPLFGEEEFTLNIDKKLPALRIPEIKLSEVDPNLFNEDGLGVIVTINNPNQFPLQVKNGSFSFMIEDNIKVAGQMEDIEIPAGGRQEVSINAKKKWGSIAQTGWDYLFNKSDTNFSYRFTGLLHSENQMLDSTKINTTIAGSLDELKDAVNM